jgi:hypothetical protein
LEQTSVLGSDLPNGVGFGVGRIDPRRARVSVGQLDVLGATGE